MGYWELASRFQFDFEQCRRRHSPCKFTESEFYLQSGQLSSRPPLQVPGKWPTVQQATTASARVHVPHYVVFEHFWLLAHAICGGFPEGFPVGHWELASRFQFDFEQCCRRHNGVVCGCFPEGFPRGRLSGPCQLDFEQCRRRHNGVVRLLPH